MRTRVAAIIIKDKKILLVRDYLSEFFSTPGGVIEGNESSYDTLEREMNEELGIKVIEINYLGSYQYNNSKLNVNQLEENYLINFHGTPKELAEIEELGWFSKEEIITNRLKELDNFTNNLLPLLLGKELL